MDVDMLRLGSNNGAFADFVVDAKSRPAFDDGASFEPAFVANDRARFHNAERSDDDVPTKLGSRINHGGGMNLGHDCPFPGPES
jgi:hypothetical protein